MSNSVYDINIEFLKQNGIELKSTGACFTPFEFENEKWIIQVDEYSYIHIRVLPNMSPKTFSLASQLLSEEDLK